MIQSLIFIISVLLATQVWAVSKDGFAVSVLHDGYPVREFSYGVPIPFDSEYTLRIKNTHERRATAKVFIDGALVSKLGDFVIPANGKLDLERFLDSSLHEGQRFKFVAFDHPDVDDPSREENGLVLVEFQHEKTNLPALEDQNLYIIMEGDETVWPIITIEPCSGDDCYTLTTDDGSWGWANSDLGSIDDTWITDGSITVSINTSSSVSPGATVPGGHSDQKFREVDIEVEDKVTILELRIVGIAEESS
jgi:hypothetical protein